jgi:hypothetical protein
MLNFRSVMEEGVRMDLLSPYHERIKVCNSRFGVRFFRYWAPAGPLQIDMLHWDDELLI